MLVVVHLQWQQWCTVAIITNETPLVSGSIVAIRTNGAMGIHYDPFTLSGDCKKCKCIDVEWILWFHYNVPIGANCLLTKLYDTFTQYLSQLQISYHENNGKGTSPFLPVHV